MARPQKEDRPLLSVFDRLLDDQPRNQHEVPPNRLQAIRQYKESVARDLEWLLNCRAMPWEPGPEFPELMSSLYMYGLQDFSNLSPVAPAHRDFLIRRVQRTIQEHEPRLTNINVTMPKDHDVKASLQMRFQVSALLLMDPAPEPVAYDTLLELSSGEYQVKGD